MTSTILFAPLIPLWLLSAACGLVAVVLAVAIWRGLSGRVLRALALIGLLGILANPLLEQAEVETLDNIIVALIDHSASSTVSDRRAQTDAALSALRAEVAALPNTRMREQVVLDDPDNRGTLLMTTLTEVLAEEPRGQIAGIIVISDGVAHDMDRLPDLSVPLHLLRTGQPTDWDRRLILSNAPSYAVMGETVQLRLLIEDLGPSPESAFATLNIAVDGNAPLTFQIPINEEVEVPFDLPHGGLNLLRFSTPLQDGELTDQNNSAIVQINGIRDRLRVLLVSGEPHAGERTWRNLLKADPAVDLVHFTILRPPGKEDGTPVNELALIAFPTRELFVEKINDFSLIVFDRYRKRGILPDSYLANIRDYVENGGAILISAGPEFGGVESLSRTVLADVTPGLPTARVVNRGYRPALTELGQRHPVTAGLTPRPDDPQWGRWFRLIETTPAQGTQVLMEGPGQEPLLILGRVGAGRAALLTSDHVWLWDRGFEGGGPQKELLRRLSHWMMKEPELEEESLRVELNGMSVRIIRRTLLENIGPATITLPDGTTQSQILNETGPGHYETLWTAPSQGFYRVTEGAVETVFALGPAAPREFRDILATGAVLVPALSQTGGADYPLETGFPRLRETRAGRPVFGDGWIGLTPPNLARVVSSRALSLIPAWLALVVVAGLSLLAWLRENRR